MKVLKVFAVILSIIVAIIICGHIFMINYMDGKFLFNTTINGVDCSSLTKEEAEEVYLGKYYNNMVFTVIDSEGKEYNITKDMFDFSDVESIDTLLSQVNTNKWYKSINNPTVFTTSDGDALVKLEKEIRESWEIFNQDNWVKSINAEIIYNDKNDNFEIKPEIIGTEVDIELFFEKLNEHIKTGSGDFVMAEQGVYAKPKITADSPELLNLLGDVNVFTDLTVEYTVGDKTSQYNTAQMKDYITFNYEDFTYEFDKETSAMNFMSKMASTYNTLGITRKFMTTLGDTVEVKGGDWGWWLNQKESANKLIEYIDSDKYRFDGEFVWLQEAVSNGDKDYFNYVEIDLTNQHLYMYKDNELVGDWDIVSGNPNKGNNTPGGTYSLTYKDYEAVLRGPGYASPVTYWMPFNGGIGMHDATWQSKFGGTRYKTHGSHGCINMPLSGAKTVFENIDNSFAIICYWR